MMLFPITPNDALCGDVISDVTDDVIGSLFH